MDSFTLGEMHCIMIGITTLLLLTLTYSQSELYNIRKANTRLSPTAHDDLIRSGLFIERQPDYKPYKPTRRGKRAGQRKLLRSRVKENITIGLWNVRSVNNKATIVNETIVDKEISLCFINETWLRENDNNGKVLHDLLPHNYQIVNIPRPVNKRGGGNALIYHQSIPVSAFSPRADTKDFTSFELMEGTIKYTPPIYVICVYRLQEVTVSRFIDELDTLLASRFTENNNLILLGDVNIHMDAPTNPSTIRFVELLDSYNLRVISTSPTHRSGHCLDIVTYSLLAYDIDNVNIEEMPVSDHYLVKCNINKILTPANITTPSKHIRMTRQIDINTFISDLETTLTENGIHHKEPVDTDTMLVQLLERHAPLTTVKHKTRWRQPWFDSNIATARRQRRKAERVYRKYPTIDNKNIFIEATKHASDKIDESKRIYYSNKILESGNPKQIFTTFTSLTSQSKQSSEILPDNIPLDELPEMFANFFSSKIVTIRNNIDSRSVTYQPLLPDTPPPTFNTFKPITIETLASILKDIKTKTCSLDPLPKEILKHCIPTLIPYYVHNINIILETAVFPQQMKQALVRPLIKKTTDDRNNLKSYRPISNLLDESKNVERVISNQLVTHITENNLFTPNQSAYRKHHSVETALTYISDSILKTIDRNQGIILILLDLSAAFDTIDHTILYHTLFHHFGISGMALRLIKSYLANRTFTVSVNSLASTQTRLPHGVPQGSILGPILFTMYTKPLTILLDSFNLNYMLYADDTQLWLPVDLDNPEDIASKIRIVEKCFLEIHKWMSANKLQLNVDKTEYLLITPSSRRRAIPHIPLTFGATQILPATQVRNLGVIFDNNFTLQQHISKTIQICHMHLRNISSIRHYLTQSATETLIHAFITSKLDFCNTLYTNLPKKNIYKLQKIQNAAAKLVLCIGKFEHVTPLLKKLHWLPVAQRSQFKVLLLTHKALYSHAPHYIKDIITEKRYNRVTRQSQTLTIESYTPRTNIIGNRIFSASSADLWNNLPSTIRSQSNFNAFKSELKTYLFNFS